MGAVNLTITYPAASTVSSILNTLLDAFTSTGIFAGAGNGLGFTNPPLEDSITGSSLFVVQADQATEPKSRMIIEVRHVVVATLDYIAFVVWDAWTPGAPGSGGNSAQVTDPSVVPADNEESRFHLIDLTNGGKFYLDGDDVDGRWLAVHSEANSVWNNTNHYVCVCSIEKSAQPNYGVLSWHRSTTVHFLRPDEDSNGCFWVPPVNHIGNPSDNQGPRVNLGVAGYYCHAPIFSYTGSFGLQASPICGVVGDAAQFDTYNGDDIVYPLYIHNSSGLAQGGTPRPAGVAYGFRGFARGVFGFRRGAASPTRFNLDDVVTSLKYIAYVGDPFPVSGVAGVPRYAIERV